MPEIKRNWLTISQFSKAHPAWTVAALRQLVHRAGKDNRVADTAKLFRPHISKLGGRYLIDEPGFLSVLEANTLDKRFGDAGKAA